MPQVKGQYTVTIKEAKLNEDGSFQVNSEEFVGIKELVELRLEEEAGLNLPFVQAAFNFDDESKYTKFVNKDFIFELSIGKDQASYQGVFQVKSDHLNTPLTGDKSQISFQIWAALCHPEYTSTERFTSYISNSEPWTSSQVWEEMCKRNKFKCITEQSNDAMMWIQCGQSDRAFLNQIVNFGYFKDSDVPLSAIRRTGEAVYLPLSSLKGKSAFKTDNTSGGARNLNLSRQHGFQTQLSGNTRVIPAYCMESGEFRTFSSKTAPQILEAGQEESVTRQSPRGFLGDNVHGFFSVAKEQNFQLRSSLSATASTVDYDDFQDVQLLQYVNMDWSNSSSSISKTAAISGDWICTKNAIHISNHSFKQFVTMARENLVK